MNKMCMDYEVEGGRQRCRPKKTWSEDREKDCQIRQIREDAMDWESQLKMSYNRHKDRV